MAKRSKASYRRAALKGWRKRRRGRGRSRRRRVRRRKWSRKAKQRVRRLYKLRKGRKEGPLPRGSIKKMRASWTKAKRKKADRMLARLRRYNTRGKVGARAKKNLKSNQKKLLNEANKWLTAAGGSLAVAANRKGRRRRRRRRR